MLRGRLIIVFVIENSRLINTVKFKEDKYLGDPINSLKVFNEFNCDELVVFDKSKSHKINFELLAKMARASRMPLAYGGGISCVADALKIFHLGFEKVSLNSSYSNELAQDISSIIGAQSVVRTIDVKKNWRGDYVDKNGNNLRQVIRDTRSDCIGELSINCIHKDGTGEGMDSKVIALVREEWHGPLTISGGLRNIDECAEHFNNHGIIGIAGTSIFVYKSKLKGILLNYPDHDHKRRLFKYH